MIRKEIHNQDSHYKLKDVHSGETSLNISLELLSLLRPGMLKGEEEKIEFTIFKSDFVNAMIYIANKMPVYVSTSTSSSLVLPSIDFFEKSLKEINGLFGNNESVNYQIVIKYRADGRVYLHSLENHGFNLRHFLLAENSILEFDVVDNKNIIRLISKPVDCLIQEKFINDFGVAVCKYFWNYDRFTILRDYFELSSNKTNYIQINYKGKILYRFLNPNLNDSSSKKWDNVEHIVDDTPYLFCHEWTEGENVNSIPSFPVLKYIIESNYTSYVVTKEGEYYVLKKKEKCMEECFTDENHTLQLIYFGAPGTSKSTTIKKQTEDQGREVHRITFHPDTDYSNFVGCYKPTKESEDSDITYKFVAQTFTKAYVSAWKQLEAKKEVFLVIEEINRGNCAQIFGDLFQLLDRNEKGYSDYKIEPDHDLQDYLAKELKDYNIPEDIKSGKAMLLPPNLYIWATMNTSDQSLFPIDSAFKRRWDWKYLPIVEPDEKKAEDKKNLVGIKIGGKEYAADWWTFLEKINTRIESLTESEDKQLGYWFAKAKTGRVIDMETFVGKVVFYLWNDIFKDFGEDDRSPFMIYQENDAEHKLSKEKITFRKFFDAKGDVKGEMVKRFIESLEVAVKEVQEDSTATVKTSSSGSDTPASEPELPLEPEPELPLESDPEDQPETEETTESIVPVTVVESHPLTEPKQTDENLF